MTSKNIPILIEFGISLFIGMLCIVVFYLGRGNYEVGARSMRLTIIGNLFLIGGQIALMMGYFGINSYKILASIYVILFTVGTTMLYWRNMRIQVQVFQLDPLLFQPSGNKIKHTGYFTLLFGKRLLIYCLIQMVWLVEIFLRENPYIYQSGLLITFGIINVRILYQVREAHGKDRIRLRFELLESFVFSFLLAIIVLVDNIFLVSTNGIRYNSSIWYTAIPIPILLFINVHNAILAAYDHVKLEKTIKNNFDSFAFVMTNQILYTMFKERVANDQNEENILFYEAFQKVRYSCQLHQLEALYEMFIVVRAPFELNLSTTIKENVRTRLEHLKNHPNETPSAEIFEEVAIEVETILYQNSFPRFVDACRGSEFTLNASRKTVSS